MRLLPLSFLFSLLPAQEPTPTVPDTLEALAKRVEHAHLPSGPVPPVTAFRANMRLSLSFLLSLLPAQEPTPTVPDTLEALAKRVEHAHLPSGPVPPVTAFCASMELHLLDAKASEGGQVDLSVKFLQWQQPDHKRPTPLIRYELKESSTPIVRGRDKNGPWLLSRGEAHDLEGPDFPTDLEEFVRHVNLARQLLRFLSPADVLRSLQHPGAVEHEVLSIARNKQVPCDTITGDLPAFPLLQRGGDDAPAHLKIYVSSAEGRLVAVDATPLVDGKPDPTKSERVLLNDLRERDGMLVPHELTHLFREADGQWHLKSKAVLIDPSLRPKLSPEDFERPH